MESFRLYTRLQLLSRFWRRSLRKRSDSVEISSACAARLFVLVLTRFITKRGLSLSAVAMSSSGLMSVVVVGGDDEPISGIRVIPA